MSNRLFCCRCTLLIRLSETPTESALYGSNPNNLLCTQCAKHEEDEIERTGTNNIPELVNTYRNSTVAPRSWRGWA